MKKLLLIFAIVCVLLLCSCSKMNQVPDNNNNYTESNSSDLISDTTSVISDFTLPERDDPSVSSSSQESSSNNVATSDPDYSDHDNTSSQLTVRDNLSIDVDKQFYRSSIKYISFTLYSDGGSFAYYTDFFLQKYVNGKWEYYTTKTGEIEYKFNAVKSDSNVVTINYDVQKLYNSPLEFGKYRFVQHSDVGTIESTTFEIVEDTTFYGDQS